MSGINGDKARFHRERKQKLARRIRNREMMERLTEAPQRKISASDSKPKAVSA
jgi:hypothetical protein